MKLISLVFGLISLVVGQEKAVVGYFVPWGKVPADQLNYAKLTHVNYGFGLLKNREDPAEIFFDEDYDGNALKSLLKARTKDVKVMISLGGWTGSQTFSKLVGDEKNRQKFISNAMVYLNEPKGEPGKDGWGLDGLDIDWEYPGRKGAECNDYSPTFEKDDTDNYLKLLQELRKEMDTKFGKGKKLLTAAVRVTPFDKDGQPLKDVSEFAKVFDFINIMAYDIMGSWEKTTGPNAPFENGPKGKAAQFSLKQAVEDWSNAKFPLNQITAGLAFYGRTQKVTADITKDNMYVDNNNGEKIQGDSMDVLYESKICREGPASHSGFFRYRLLRQQGVLVEKTKAGQGWERFFDSTTKTPYLYNKQEKKFISYDDVESLKIKVDYAIEKKLKGVMYWDMTMDYNDELLDVLQAVRGSSAKSDDCSGDYCGEPTTVPDDAKAPTDEGPEDPSDCTEPSENIAEPNNTQNGNEDGSEDCDQDNPIEATKEPEIMQNPEAGETVDPPDYTEPSENIAEPNNTQNGNEDGSEDCDQDNPIEATKEPEIMQNPEAGETVDPPDYTEPSENIAEPDNTQNGNEDGSEDCDQDNPIEATKEPEIMQNPEAGETVDPPDYTEPSENIAEPDNTQNVNEDGSEDCDQDNPIEATKEPEIIQNPEAGETEDPSDSTEPSENIAEPNNTQNGNEDGSEDCDQDNPNEATKDPEGLKCSEDEGSEEQSESAEPNCIQAAGEDNPEDNDKSYFDETIEVSEHEKAPEPIANKADDSASSTIPPRKSKGEPSLGFSFGIRDGKAYNVRY